MTSDRFATGLKPPYYAVIFTNQQSSNTKGYDETADRMMELAQTMPGFLGVESTRDETGLGITVSYWQDRDSISNWKANDEHTAARKSGNEKWYDHYELRIAKIERTYNGPRK